MKRDLIITFVINIIIIVSGILSYKLAIISTGINGFSEYSLVRRILSFLQSVFLLGLGVGLTRYISISLKEKGKKINYFLSGLILISLSSLSFFICSILFKEKLALLFFGDRNYLDHVQILAVMLYGILLHSAIYSYYRGAFQIQIANLIQLINLGIIPLIYFLFEDNIKVILTLIGISWLVVSFVFVILILTKEKILSSLKLLNIEDLKELFFYSIKRVPADIGLSLLFTFPVFFVTHLYSIELGGIVAFGISLLNMVTAVFATLGVILLPKVSILYSEGRTDLIVGYTKRILLLSLIFSIIVALLFHSFGNFFLKHYLGDKFADHAQIVKIIFLGIIPHTIYVVLRSIIDAVFKTAYNTRNIICSLFILLIFSIISGMNSLIDVKAYLLMFDFSLLMLSLFSIIIVSKIKT